MFTGIVQGMARIAHIDHQPGLKQFQVDFPSGALNGVQIGASVAIDGACLTVVRHEGDSAWFDVMMESLAKTTLEDRQAGDAVNYERAARFGDEIGGHLLSGHVHCTARLRQIDTPENNRRLWFEVPQAWQSYLFAKGYVAVNGCSLTIGDVDARGFNVYLIPETLRATTFQHLVEGDRVNVEIDSQTQTIVDALARMNLKPVTD